MHASPLLFISFITTTNQRTKSTQFRIGILTASLQQPTKRPSPPCPPPPLPFSRPGAGHCGIAMTLLTFFGCAFTAYGPSLAIFFGYIAPNAQLVILMVSSAFFWLLSLLLASAIWFLATNSRNTFTTTIIYTVLLQELFRWCLYLLINRAEGGLNMVAKHPKSKFNRSGYAFSAGMGFGLMFGIISYITQLVESLGPGVLMCPSCPSISLYFISGI